MTRYAHEWEATLNKKEEKMILNRNINRLREEIKRISTTTLRGNFANPEDREYWVKRLSRLNGELIAFERQQEAGR